jgi:hypothetical protein
MNTIRIKWISALMAAILLINTTAAFAGLDSKKAQYVGGTVVSIIEGAEGSLDASGETQVVFRPDKKKGPSYSIPYSNVTALGYGQHAGRRVGATIALGVTTMGIGALPILFSKKRRHYLTINFKDNEGKDQAAIFELGKDTTRTLLATLAARTGKTVEYEDDEARKSGNK